MFPACLLMLVTTGAPPPADNRPTLALLRIEAQKGVQADTTQVLADHVVGTVRRTGRFSRVVSGRDLEAVLDLQRQKQLLDCDTESCMVEIAGALGVDFLMLGGVARLGTTYVVNLRIVEASSGVARGSYNETLPGAQEDALLSSMERGVAQMMKEWQPGRGPASTGALARPPQSPATTLPPAPTAATPPPAPVAAPPRAEPTPAVTPVPAPAAEASPAQAAARTTDNSGGGGPGMARIAALGAGGVLLGVAVLGGLLGVALGAGGLGLKGFINNVPSPLGAQLTAVQVTYVTAWIVGALGLVLSLLVLGGGMAALVTGVVL